MKYFKIILLVCIFGGGVFAGYKLFHPKSAMQTQVNAQVIVTALHDRGFFVTQTYVFDQPVTITKSFGSTWKDFFFGQTITARGTMEVNLGTDLAQVKEEDVALAADTITVKIPRASLFNTRLIGPIEVQNQQGILKKLFNSDDGYNAALAELTKVAEAEAQKPERLDLADQRAKDDLTRLLSFLVKDKKIQVEVK